MGVSTHTPWSTHTYTTTSWIKRFLKHELIDGHHSSEGFNLEDSAQKWHKFSVNFFEKRVLTISQSIDDGCWYWSDLQRNLTTQKKICFSWTNCINTSVAQNNSVEINYHLEIKRSSRAAMTQIWLRESQDESLWLIWMIMGVVY